MKQKTRFSNIRKAFVQSIMYISRQEREKRSFSRYVDERKIYQGLTDRELQARPVDIKVSYEQKKLFFSVLFVSVLLAAVTDAWQCFFNFITAVLQLYLADSMMARDAATASFLVASIIFAGVLIMVFLMLFLFLRELKLWHWRLLIIQDVLRDRGL